MPLDDLVSVIEMLQQRIRDHGTTLRENETRTRMALIDPLLTALGWDVSDPAAVTPEYSAGDGRADYALLNEGRPAVLIEAKHLNEPLERIRHQDQVFGYARRSRIKFAGITDGDTWVLEDLSVFEGEPRILDISIANTPTHECALKLLMLWRPNLASGQPMPAEKSLFGLPPDEDGAPTPNSDGVRGRREILRNKDEEPIDDWITLSNLIVQRGSAPPQAIRFGNGPEQTIGRWRDILTKVVAWTWSQGYLNDADIPLRLGRQRYLIHTEAVHPTGREFAGPVPIVGSPLYVEANLSAPDCAKHAINLLTHCGISPDTVWLKIEP